MQIQETIPRSYTQFTSVIYESTKQPPFRSERNIVEYPFLDQTEFKKAIEKILKEEKDITEKERKYLKYALKIFSSKKRYITKEEFINLSKYAYEAIFERLELIRKELIQKDINSSEIDHEFFFAISQLLNQTNSLKKGFKNKNIFVYLKKNSKKLESLYLNLLELIRIILTEDYKSLKDVTNSILEESKIEFDITHRILK